MIILKKGLRVCDFDLFLFRFYKMDTPIRNSCIEGAGTICQYVVHYDLNIKSYQLHTVLTLNLLDCFSSFETWERLSINLHIV
jgi:hypothetical protein